MSERAGRSFQGEKNKKKCQGHLACFEKCSCLRRVVEGSRSTPLCVTRCDLPERVCHLRSSSNSGKLFQLVVAFASSEQGGGGPGPDGGVPLPKAETLNSLATHPINKSTAARFFVVEEEGGVRVPRVRESEDKTGHWDTHVLPVNASPPQKQKGGTEPGALSGGGGAYSLCFAFLSG